MIDFEWYRSFISIYKHRSVSEAAKARYMTQPAMSQHLAALEAEVGDSLFTRAPRKMLPTERGKELYSRLVPLIEELEQASLEFKLTSDPSVPIVHLASAAEYFMGKALDTLSLTPYKFYTKLGPASLLIQWLKDEKADVIITPQKIQEPGIEYLKMEEEEFVLVAPPDFNNPDTQNHLEEFLVLQKWLSYGPELPIIRRFWRHHFKKRPSIQPFHIMPDLRAVLKAIELGMGISLLPTYLIRESVNNGSSKILFPELTVTNELYLAFKLKNKESPILQEMLNTFTGKK